MQIHILLVDLVVILAIGTEGQIGVEDDAAVLGAEEAGVGVAHGGVSTQAVRSVELIRAETPSSLDWRQPMGNVMGVLKSASKSKALRVYLRK